MPRSLHWRSIVKICNSLGAISEVTMPLDSSQ